MAAADRTDRLSILPDEILHHILSFIPDTEEKARTSVLSKRWKCLWHHQPFIRLGRIREPRFLKSNSEIEDHYRHSVDRCFNSFASPALHSLDFFLLYSNPQTNTHWIRFAGLHSVRELHLASAPTGKDCDIPQSIFSCKLLNSLDVTFCSINRIPSHFQGFNCLTSLRFSCSHIEDKPFNDLLLKCPLLESLSLSSCHYVTSINISSDRLRHIDIFYCRDLESVRFCAPNLESVKFQGNVKFLFLQYTTCLRTADIIHFCYDENSSDMTSQDDWQRPLLDLSHAAKKLRVNHWLFKFVLPRGSSPVFKNLKELECLLEWVTAPVLQGIASLLDNCPNLEKFFLDLYIGSRRDAIYEKVQHDGLLRVREFSRSSGEEWFVPEEEEQRYITTMDSFNKQYEDDQEREIWDPSELGSGFGDCTLRLKTVVVKAFLGTSNEMRLLEYLLSKANALETLTIGDGRTHKKVGVHQLLANIPRGSPHVQIREMKVAESVWDHYFESM